MNFRASQKVGQAFKFSLPFLERDQRSRDRQDGACQKLIRAQSAGLSRWDQTRLAKANDQRVEKAQVCTAPSHELRTGNGGEDSAGLCLTLAFRNGSRG